MWILILVFLISPFQSLAYKHPVGMAKGTEISSDKLQLKIEKSALQKHAEAIYQASLASVREFPDPNRLVGLQGLEGTFLYLINELQGYGGYYEVSTQRFEAGKGRVTSFEVLINGKQSSLAKPFNLTPPTPQRKPVRGNLVYCGVGCDASAFEGKANGNIVLVSSGECTYSKKLRTAGLAGAVGMVAFDPETLEIKVPSDFGDFSEDHIASIQVLGEEGRSYVKMIENGETLTVSICVDSYVRKVWTQNIIAETRDGDHNNVIVLGAHSDSVSTGPGMNDDGSGIISLLEVANKLRDFDISSAVRFVWFSAEEQGLVGSRHYISQLLPGENSKIRMFMNFDMIASPNYEYQVYNSNNQRDPPGLGNLRDLFVKFYDSNNLKYTLAPFDGRSDYANFVLAGIPAGGVSTGAEGINSGLTGQAGKAFDPCYHQRCDDLRNLDYDAWLVNTRLVAHAVATYAKSLSSFPVRGEHLVT